PGLEETVGKNQRLFERGNPKLPGEEVPRRFLEAIDSTPYQTPLSGRRQLAEDLLRDDNPLTRRVIVNRIWHHLFGRGIVGTPDNFGRLGMEPTHPELLDYLATRFKDHGGSIKEMIRFLVTSKTWREASRPSDKARELDPDNRLWSHARVRRMEAESIRDEMLAISGALAPELFGPPVDGNSPRRSIYVRVRRNAIDPFLRAFDFPEPFSATGRRDVTNVPAQSLTMMNDDHVAALASTWATRVLADATLATDRDRIRDMFLTALGRPAEPAEMSRFTAYLEEAKRVRSKTEMQVADLRRRIDEGQSAIAAICQPIRGRLIAKAGTTPQSRKEDLPHPIGRWEFKTDLQDLAGSAHGQARGGARVQAGALALDHHGFVVTLPLKQTIKEKTLEVWVQLDDLDQRGGGVMSIQTPDGAVFDAIVFAEQNPRQWMAGSNFFQRTQSFNAPPERQADRRPVHLAIAYHADGRIAAYRDGQPYGAPYQSSGPVEFKAGNAVIGFGIRHLPEGGNKMLGGRILRAQLYDRALSGEEILASSQSAPFYVDDAQVRAAMTESERRTIAQDEKQLADFQKQLCALGPVSPTADDKTPLTDLARAMFLFKEFIYVK
ncbi:MAG TPA: DUF1553 domain-containing protein, partial [Tepidisphaeraceae bacterium]|nr:DUF1553 domain-containing protein [Tepidisphaeraceae bacterium]